MKFSQFAKAIRVRFPTASLVPDKLRSFLCTEFISDGFWVRVSFVDSDGEHDYVVEPKSTADLPHGWRVLLYPTSLLWAFKTVNHRPYDTFEEAFQAQVVNCYENLDGITKKVIELETALDKFSEGTSNASEDAVRIMRLLVS